ncbi:MAG: metallophosphoesterase [Bdellovibrionales bacterium]|nr:metallophosphoesterase [Bdellovibrionales bacterium]
MVRLFFLMSILIAYTAYKVAELIPSLTYLTIPVAFVFFILMLAPTFVTRLTPKLSEQTWFAIPTWVGSLLIGFFGTYIMISLPIDTVHFFYSIIYPEKIFLSPEAYQYILLIAFIMSFFGFIEVLRGPKVVDVDISIKNLPHSLESLKIAQISDLHIGPTIQSRYVKKVVAKTNSTNPDLIFITGDLVDGNIEATKKHLLPLKDLKARYGIYYVTGNHEYYWGIEKLIPEIKKVGFDVLMNENRIIEVGNAKILLVGIPDPMAGVVSKENRPDLIKAKLNETPTDLKILLAHRPDPYKEANKEGFQLQFSGHTHAGQFFPFSLFISFAHKYYRGLSHYENLKLYVNPGTGYWGPANRFGIASEITLAHLKAE